MTKEKPLHLVYTVGKVGTYTMHAMLRRVLPVSRVYRAHALTDKGIKAYERFKEMTAKRERRAKMAIEKRPNSTVKVVTLTRDPVAREISSLFHNIEVYFPDVRHDELALSDITNMLIENTHSHDYSLNWFDNELREFFGVNVYDTNFPHEKGYKIIRNRKVEVLIVRLEDLNECVSDAMEDYFGLNVDGYMEHRNVGNMKRYSEIYNRFKSNAKIPRNFIEYFYDSKFAKHFYSDTELKAFKHRWL